MIEILKGDELVKKIGGVFRLTALMQRRMKELLEGSRPLVDTRDRTIVEVVLQEIKEDKIAIDYDKSKLRRLDNDVTGNNTPHDEGVDTPESQE